jgi:type VI secretion system protein ImpJ
LWGEGLFLRPQNFQRQDAYHEHRLHNAVKSIQPYNWGLQSIKIDHEALATGMLRLTELNVIFPDGEQFATPQHDEPPPPLSLENENLGDSAIIYAALPLMKDLGGNLRMGEGIDADIRYNTQQSTTPDYFTKAISADITYLRKNVRLVSDKTPRDHMSAVPVLRLRRNANAGYEVDHDFIAPALAIQSSPGLNELLKHILDALQAKVSTLYGYHREPSQHIIEFRSGDVASFWLLHTANAAHAALMHLHRNALLHPERLFQELLRLAGSLLTFSKEYSLADLPAYNHSEPNEAFSKLNQMLRDLLETVISTRYFSIMLSEIRPTFHTGRLDSGKIDERTALFLAVGSSMPAAQLEDIVPLRFKAGSPDDVEKLVLSAMPGVPLTYTPQVPAAVPVKPGTAYFALQSQGALYEHMLQAKNIAIYAPSGIPDLRLELIAVTQ